MVCINIKSTGILYTGKEQVKRKRTRNETSRSELVRRISICYLQTKFGAPLTQYRHDEMSVRGWKGGMQ